MTFNSIDKIVVLSTSAVKQRAVVRWLRTKRRLRVPVVCIEACPTDCPQPVTLQSALECLAKRLPINRLEHGVLYLGIENFIEFCPFNCWADNVAVSATCVNADGVILTATSVGLFANYIPRKFSPKNKPDVTSPLGFKFTVGQQIHDSHGEIPHDDWGPSVIPHNVDRVTQIFDALRRLNLKIGSTSRQSREY